MQSHRHRQWLVERPRGRVSPHRLYWRGVEGDWRWSPGSCRARFGSWERGYFMSRHQKALVLLAAVLASISLTSTPAISSPIFGVLTRLTGGTIRVANTGLGGASGTFTAAPDVTASFFWGSDDNPTDGERCATFPQNPCTALAFGTTGSGSNLTNFQLTHDGFTCGTPVFFAPPRPFCGGDVSVGIVGGPLPPFTGATTATVAATIPYLCCLVPPNWGPPSFLAVGRRS